MISYIDAFIGIIVALIILCFLKIAKRLLQDYREIESNLKWFKAHRKKDISEA